MEPFATVEQYEARYGDVADMDILLEVLKDATREISAALERAGIDYENPSELFAENLMQVCRSMAFRSVGTSEVSTPFGATQFSQGVGDFSQSFSFKNPYGEVYISKAERRLLGLDSAKIGFTIPGGA